MIHKCFLLCIYRWFIRPYSPFLRPQYLVPKTKKNRTPAVAPAVDSCGEYEDEYDSPKTSKRTGLEVDIPEAVIQRIAKSQVRASPSYADNLWPPIGFLRQAMGSVLVENEAERRRTARYFVTRPLRCLQKATKLSCKPGRQAHEQCQQAHSLRSKRD